MGKSRYLTCDYKTLLGKRFIHTRSIPASDGIIVHYEYN